MTDLFNYFINNRFILLTSLGGLIILLVIIFLIIILKEKRTVEKEDISLEDYVEPSENNNKLDLTSMLNKMSEDLKEKDIHTFEEEQEGKSIISYQELLASAEQRKKTINSVTIQPEINTQVNEFIEKIKAPETDNKKFKNTEFISPIYGVQNNNINYPTVKEQSPFMNEEKEIKEKLIIQNEEKEYVWATNSKNEEFLITLKEFRKKLD